MEFTYTDEQEALRDSVRRFCEREHDFETRQEIVKSAHGFDPTNWASFAELGWLGAGLSEEEGGFGGGPIENAILLEELAKGLVTAPFLSSAVMATQVVARIARGDQRDALLESMIAGEKIAALAHGEGPRHRLDGECETRIETTKTGYRLSGRKTGVLGGKAVDVFYVTARDHSGLSLFVVPADVAGMTRLDYEAVDGRRVCDLLLDGVELGLDALVGEAGKAESGVSRALDYGAVGLCAEAVGAMDAVLWITRDYIKTRKQFGETLNTFQALRHRMADMLVELEVSRAMLCRGLAALTQEDAEIRKRSVSAAKAQIGESGWFVGKEAVQLHGGIGVTDECNVGHYFKRLTLIRGLLGSSDDHVMRYANSSVMN